MKPARASVIEPENSAAEADALLTPVAPQGCSPNAAEGRLDPPDPRLDSAGAAARFTRDGQDALEEHLARVCWRTLAGIQSLVPAGLLEAVVLGGGYGRGEGGVLKTPSGDQPYNDLEFYVFLRGSRLWNERRFFRPLAELGERLSPEAGLHVEFKIDALSRIRRGPVTMFSYDLVSGHRVIHSGPEPAFAGCEHHRDAARIPPDEATRLLLNRCTGLLLARELLLAEAFTLEHADFVGRNIAKAQLALGDAILAVFGKYHWSCLERHRRLEQLVNEPVSRPLFRLKPAWLDGVLKGHASATRFKLHPVATTDSRGTLEARHEQVSALALQVWLWVESRRLHQPFASALDYALSPIAKCPGAPAWRNALLNLRSFGAPAVLGAPGWRYPRERLLNSLPLLLWDEAMIGAQIGRHLQKQLRTRASDWQSLVAAYKRVWPAFG